MDMEMEIPQVCKSLISTYKLIQNKKMVNFKILLRPQALF